MRVAATHGEMTRREFPMINRVISDNAYDTALAICAACACGSLLLAALI
jgi:hypothetical protein